MELKYLLVGLTLVIVLVAMTENEPFELIKQCLYTHPARIMNGDSHYPAKPEIPLEYIKPKCSFDPFHRSASDVYYGYITRAPE